MKIMETIRSQTNILKMLAMAPSLALVGCLDGGAGAGSESAQADLSAQLSMQAKVGVFLEADDSQPSNKKVVVSVDRVSIRNESGDPISAAGSGQLVELTSQEVKLPSITLAQDQLVSSREIRLILMDSGNTYTRADGSVCSLKTPSAQQSGLKIKLPETFTFQQGLFYSIHLAFDVEKSIVEQGNGGCLLKPVIKGEIIAYRPPVDDGGGNSGGSGSDGSGSGGSSGGDTGSGSGGDTGGSTGGDTGGSGGGDTGTGGDVPPVVDVVYQPESTQVVDIIAVDVSN